MEHVYIITDIGVNHNGKLETAKQLVDVAVDAGVDAVKLQMFNPEEIASESAPLAEYQKSNVERSKSQKEMLAELTLTEDEYREILSYTKEKEIDLIVTPYDIASAQFLVSIGIETLKIPSCEVTNIPFLEEVAQLNVPIILSSGTCNLEEVDDAVSIFKDAGVDLILLHCTSSYPTPFDQVNLRVMETLRKKFGVQVGLSDHTPGIAVPIAAAALGAVIIEKHFTLDKHAEGPDHKASLEPDEVRAMVEGVRAAQAALGSSEKVMQPAEENTAAVARRSVVAACDLAAGDPLTKENTAIKRPGTGIAPKEYDAVLGKAVSRDVVSGTPITHEMLQ